MLGDVEETIYVVEEEEEEGEPKVRRAVPGVGLIGADACRL